MRTIKSSAAARIILLFAVCCFFGVIATPRAAWCETGTFREGNSFADFNWRWEFLNGVSRFGEVPSHMPGAGLRELARLESAAAWQQLRDKADQILSVTEFSSEEQGWAYLYRGWGALGENDLPAASSDAIAARYLLPRELQAVLLLCIVQARQGMAQEAEAYLKEQAQWSASGSERDMALAAFYQDRGDWESARHWYGEALRKEPNAARINASLAIVSWRLGQAREAVGLMSRAAELSPGNADFWNERGMMFLSLGQVNEALADFNTALKLDDRHCGVLLNRGNLFFYNGHPDLAERDFSLGLRFYSRDVGLLTSRASVYTSQGRYAEARQDLETAFAVASQNVRVLNDFAWFLATCPDSRYWNGTQAVSLALTAITNDQFGDPGLYDTLAASQARAGDFEAAVASQGEALLKGWAQGVPDDVLNTWERRLQLYLRGQTYEQMR
jgi:Flp pilus assembly protein TadD